jgi:hypothetical protein
MSSGAPKPASNLGEPERLEDAVLDRVLELHPVGVTVTDLTGDLEAELASADPGADIGSVIEGLAQGGLLSADVDGTVTATPAAVHYGELLQV